MTSWLRLMGFILGLLCSGAWADTDPPLTLRLHLQQIEARLWRVDYAFSEPITELALGPRRGDYREKAWEIVTPGLGLQVSEGLDAIRGTGAPFWSFSLRLHAYGSFPPGGYAPMVQFSDGGTALYLAYLVGTALQGERRRPVQVELSHAALPGQNVLGPHQLKANAGNYLYFGPQRPRTVGATRLVMDSTTPDWLAKDIPVLLERFSSFFEQALEQPLPTPLTVWVGVQDLEQTGVSLKGGAVGGQVVLRLSGVGLVDPSPKLRDALHEVVVHELAHIWQSLVPRGGINAQEPWVHEGGAEQLALAALERTGHWSPEQAEAHAKGLLSECENLKQNMRAYRGQYACGYARLRATGMDAIELWKGLRAATAQHGVLYGAALIDEVLRQAAP